MKRENTREEKRKKRKEKKHLVCALVYIGGTQKANSDGYRDAKQRSSSKDEIVQEEKNQLCGRENDYRSPNLPYSCCHLSK